MRCQECGNNRAVYNVEIMSGALCLDCVSDFLADLPDPYDYPNEREYQERCRVFNGLKYNHTIPERGIS